jgi:formate C-acetyltransferase
MKNLTNGPTKTDRITKLTAALFAGTPVIEASRAVLLTESYRQTEGEPIITRRAKAFEHILTHIPISIRDNELIVGSSTIAPRGCQTYPEFSFNWLEAEFETVATRSADPFYISDKSKKEIAEANRYWRGKTTSELASSYMAAEALTAIEHNIFTAGNYFYNGVGHVTPQYETVLANGLEGVIAKAEAELASRTLSEADYQRRSHFINAVIRSCKAVIHYAHRYAELAEKTAKDCKDPARKTELIQIAQNCKRVPAKGAQAFYEACQSFWFIQQLIQLESSGHSISPGRFDQYMYPYYKRGIDSGKTTPQAAQELLDCIWVKLNDLNKCRDAASAEGFAGYSLFQNLIVGGQDSQGNDVTNDLSYMCITASQHVHLPQPSLSLRVWNKTPHELLVKAAELTRSGIGLPAYFNDETIIPALMNRGVTLADARNYNIIGCVEPQAPGKTEGWHDAAFFNMCRPLELVFSNGVDKGRQISVQTGEIEAIKCFDDFMTAYKKQMLYNTELLVNANNAIDAAHAERCPLPFLSCLVDDCIARGKSVQEGGAVYNFTGPQGFGVANVADSLYAIKTLVFEQKKYTLNDFKRALATNYGKHIGMETAAVIASGVVKELEVSGKKLTPEQISAVLKEVLGTGLSDNERKLYEQMLEDIEKLPKFGNDDDTVDALAREAAYAYTKPLEAYKNPRGGIFQAGLYPVSANVPLGAQTGATPDGRLAGKPVADGVSPSAGKDKLGPTAAMKSVSKLDHITASNGTLFNQKFHPSALEGRQGIETFIALLRTYFDMKGSHAQFNVVSRETLLDAQANPDNHKHLVVRVAGYSALFTTLSRSLQDDIINRTQQGQ